MSSASASMAKKKGAAAAAVVHDSPSSSAHGEESFHADPSQNPSHPYYVHPSENPSMILVSPVLDGKKYYEWARSMRMALATKNKIRFIDGSISKPDSFDPLLPFWERCNNLLLFWIQCAIPFKQCQVILYLLLILFIMIVLIVVFGS